MNSTLHLSARGCTSGTLYLATLADSEGQLQLDVCGEEALLALLNAPYDSGDDVSSSRLLLEVPCDQVKSGAATPRSTTSFAMWTTTVSALALAIGGQEIEPRLRWSSAGVAALALLTLAAEAHPAAASSGRTALDFVVIAYLPESWSGNVTADDNIEVIDLRTKPSATPSPTTSPTPSISVSPTQSPTQSPTSSPPVSITVSPSVSPTPSVSVTPSPSPSSTPPASCNLTGSPCSFSDPGACCSLICCAASFGQCLSPDSPCCCSF